MSAITFQVPDDLAARLRSQEGRLPEILELGLRELTAGTQPGFEGASDVLEVLASLPSPAEVVALRPSERLQARVEDLLEKNREGGLTSEEESEWERYQYLEHLVRIAKAKAHQRLAQARGDG